MTQLHITTPVLAHRPLSAQLHKSVWLKMDNLQPSGSFKLRGIGLMCSALLRWGATFCLPIWRQRWFCGCGCGCGAGSADHDFCS
jgi:L-serine/L-threonine ammonia-lyase